MQFAWQSNGYFQSYTTIYDYNGSLTGYFFISHLAFSFQFSSSMYDWAIVRMHGTRVRFGRALKVYLYKLKKMKMTTEKEALAF